MRVPVPYRYRSLAGQQISCILAGATQTERRTMTARRPNDEWSEIDDANGNVTHTSRYGNVHLIRIEDVVGITKGRRFCCAYGQYSPKS
jgi:hypothetical protein